MDIDFALVLVSIVFITGFIWLIDHFLFLPKREKNLENFKTSGGLTVGALYSELGQDSYLDGLSDKDRAAVESIGKEPILVEYAKSFFPVFFIVLILRSFLVEPFTIPSASMVPTLKIGDYILVNKFAYGLRLPVIGTMVYEIDEPKRGDIMVFKFPENPKINYIKRVVGLPGDRIRYDNNKILTINGEVIENELMAKLPPSLPSVFVYKENLNGTEHQMQHMLRRPGFRAKDWVVPEGQYFMMGDNRDNSNDSRGWGFVPDKNVVGKAFAIWMNKKPGFHLPTFSRNGLVK